MAARKPPMYKCFVDNCSTLSLNPSQRIDHLRTVHKYPKKFNFDIVLGQDGMMPKRKGRAGKDRNQGERKQQSKVETVGDVTKILTGEGKKETLVAKKDEMDLDDGLVNLASKIAQVSIVPRSIKFGGRAGRERNTGGSSLEQVKALHQHQAPPPPSE